MDRILVVDDDPDVYMVVQGLLRNDECIVESASDGRQALSLLKRRCYDLMLLDLRMPMNGMLVMAKARELDADLVIIVFTAHDTTESAIEAVRQGAFDYLYKTTEPEIVMQRIKEGLQHRKQTELRRYYVEQIELFRKALAEMPAPPLTSDERFVRSGPLLVDICNRSASFGGRMLNLTTSEYDVLLTLVKASPSLVEFSQLVTALGYQVSTQEAREITKGHIHRLRSKIGDDPRQPKHIKVVRHKGYLWCAE